MSLCSGCGNPVIDGTCACPGVVADLKEKLEQIRKIAHEEGLSDTARVIRIQGVLAE